MGITRKLMYIDLTGSKNQQVDVLTMLSCENDTLNIISKYIQHINLLF
jgi:hypothetical protein